MEKAIFSSIAFCMFSLLFTFNSCSKESSNLSVEPSLATETFVSNPFDFVGELHNAGLDAVYKELATTKASVINEEDVMKLADNFCEVVFSKDERFDFEISDTKAGNTDYENIEEVTISEETSDYIEKIISVVSTEDYNYIKEQFATFEEDIINNKSNVFTEYEAELLLCSIAIGKYSNEYWKDSNVSTKSNVGRLVGADVGGAIQGIVKQAPVIIICTMLGGIGGAIGATGRAALKPALVASALAGLTICGDMLL